MSNRPEPDVGAARRRAEACLALARSTTFEGERATAIARGLELCARSGLAPDDFDIPGRVPAAARQRAAGRAPDRYSAADVAEVMRAFRATMDASFFEAEAASRAAAARDLAEEIFADLGAMEGETAFDARQRNFNEAVRAAKERDRRRAATGQAA